MLYTLRFYAYDDAHCKTFHYLRADLQTRSLDGFKPGQPIVLTEQGVGSIAQTYVITQQPSLSQPLEASTGLLRSIDVFVMSEPDWQAGKRSLTQLGNPWWGPTL